MTRKEKEILEYCKGHTHEMWAAVIVGIILECDFRDSPIKLKEYFNE